jgi:hypothetical protein
MEFGRAGCQRVTFTYGKSFQKSLLLPPVREKNQLSN